MSKVPAKRWQYIIPVAAIMYMLAYMDRINVSMILPYVGGNFHLTSAATGFASGIFFFGYMVLQIPGGYLASRWSAKRVVFILMMLWGISAMATALVQSTTELYVMRFVLGIFEGGVWPAVLVLLASWFPQNERARANALWMACLPVSSIIMTPITGWLLTVASWRDVFFIEGLPPIIWGIVWWFALSDRPSEARWISDQERSFIQTVLASENNKKPANGGFKQALGNKTVWILIAVYLCWITGFYGFSLWVPSVIKEFKGVTNSGMVGILSAIPFIFAFIAMILNSAWSDKRGKRQSHIAVPVIIAALSLILGQLVAHDPTTKMIFLVITAMAVYSPYGPFWAIPSSLLRIEIVGASMGLINAIGNLGGFLGPYMVGYVKQLTGSGFAGFFLLAVFLLITVIFVALLRTDKRAQSAIDETQIAG
ncbi:MFS transporter [Alicyclobacillus dauci]|uniref:MFS transporter n=1 Tax=Alicyclobacillus dauci TaxID=1475485 RepID=A0ABY6Z0F7_9BACL|nr:MFS transporter [Alicyclobacillus dauci]WAH36353.1 MFS transporter [Alicyclobacillus dauci]WAH39381.1 MFS transporter [Alicyclobacillus dauci]